MKIYKCCICHQTLKEKPIRLVKQLHDNKECYGRYMNVHNYDFCKKCYMKFNNWIKKHEVKNGERITKDNGEF